MKNAVIAIVITAVVIAAIVIVNRSGQESPSGTPPDALPDIDIEQTSAPPPEPDGLTNPDRGDGLGNAEPEAEPVVGPPPDAGTDETDAFIYERFNNSDPILVEMFSRDNLIRKLVTATDLVSREKNPYRPFSFIRFKGSLRLEEREGRTFLGESNHQRYDAYVTSIASLGTDDLGQVYTLLLPFIESAYAELGNTDRGWQETINAALDSALAYEPPTQTGEVEVVGKDGVYIFADPELEKLSPVHKAFLRMGPENTAKLQALLRKVRGQVQQP